MYTMRGGGVKTLLDVELKKNEKSCREICNNHYSCLLKLCVSNVDPSTVKDDKTSRRRLQDLTKLSDLYVTIVFGAGQAAANAKTSSFKMGDFSKEISLKTRLVF